MSRMSVKDGRILGDRWHAGLTWNECICLVDFV